MKHLIELFCSDEDDAWVAIVPDLSGCEAVREVQDATDVWIMACEAAGEPVPEPSAKARQAA